MGESEYRKWLRKIKSKLDPYATVRPYPSWKKSDLEDFIASEPDVHGPAIKDAFKVKKFAAIGSIVCAAGSAPFYWRVSRSPPATLFTTVMGAWAGWVIGYEIGSHWTQFYLKDPFAAYLTFLERMHQKARKVS